MRQNLVYVASPRQAALTRTALSRISYEQNEDLTSPAKSEFKIKNAILGELVLHVHVIDNLDAITPHLRQNPVDLLIYDERGEGGIDARTALAKIRDDVAAFAELWGPDFLFPMSRVVTILAEEDHGAQRAFELGRVHIRDVCVAPRNTAAIMRWLHRVLTKGIERDVRVGVAMSGGGIEGFLYQAGCIQALQHATTGRSLHDCHVYSGVSSGAIGAAMLAAQVPLHEVIRALNRKSETLRPLGSADLFDLAGTDILKRVLMESISWSGINIQKWINKTLRSIPTGFFKGEALEEYFREVLTSAGVGDRFSDLNCELYVGTTDQDSFEHVVMGRAPWDNVPISQALRASAALPPLFVPTPIGGHYFIDGQVTRTCNLELVIERGCRLIFIIDPLRPFAMPIPGSVDKLGGVYAMIQVIKALVYTRFQQTLVHLTERYPDIDFIVLQPDEECARLMSGSPMRFSMRTQIIELAFRDTLRKLRERHHVYTTKLSRYGISLRSPEKLLELEREPEAVERAAHA